MVSKSGFSGQKNKEERKEVKRGVRKGNQKKLIKNKTEALPQGKQWKDGGRGLKRGQESILLQGRGGRGREVG